MNEVWWFFSGWVAGSLFTVGALLGLSRWAGGHRLSEQPWESSQEKPPAEPVKKKHRTMWD